MQRDFLFTASFCRTPTKVQNKRTKKNGLQIINRLGQDYKSRPAGSLRCKSL